MLKFRTFTDIGMIPDGGGAVDPDANLVALNNELRTGDKDTIIVGSSGTFTVGSGITSFIVLQSSCFVQRLPDCTIRWAFATKPGNTDFGLVVAADGVTNARWSGGTFAAIPDASGNYPKGGLFLIEGSDILVEDVTTAA